MNVDLIDMNAFMGDEPQEENATSRTKISDGSDQSHGNSLQTDFLADDEIGLRDHSEATVLTPIVNPYGEERKTQFNLVSHEPSKDDFL